MSLPIPVDASKIPAAIADRTRQATFDSPDGGQYTLTIYRESVYRNAAGAKISTEPTETFTVTLPELMALTGAHPELKRFFVLPNLLKDLCDAIAQIDRQAAIDLAAAQAVADANPHEPLALENHGVQEVMLP